MNKKFSDMLTDDDPNPLTHVWKPIYERSKRGDRERIVAAVSESGIDLILKLIDGTSGPFCILYVLVVPRGREPGRYQMNEWISYESLVTFLERYRAYFEGDGRHDIWINCGGESLVVYDRHEVLYLYDDVDRFQSVLDSMGYEVGEVTIDFPHAHHFNAEFDADQDSIVDSDAYTRFDIVVGQDIPE